VGQLFPDPSPGRTQDREGPDRPPEAIQNPSRGEYRVGWQGVETEDFGLRLEVELFEKVQLLDLQA
jgi:hypothetical protein